MEDRGRYKSKFSIKGGGRSDSLCSNTKPFFQNNNGDLTFIFWLSLSEDCYSQSFTQECSNFNS